MFLQWRGEVSHASVLLRVRGGQDFFIACRLASSEDGKRSCALWAHYIIAHVHRHHRRRMLVR
jgi:hypothetical protein